MKIAFGMIVFEGDYVLKECLECVYPFADQILIAEGPVRFWQEQGKTTSEDEPQYSHLSRVASRAAIAGNAEHPR